MVQQMSESLLLSLLGGAAGALLAILGMEPFLSLMPDDLPRLGEMQVDWRLLVTAGGFAILTGILTGLLPALRAAGTPITAVLQEGGRSLAGGRSRNRAQAALVVSQIALAFVLLFGAGLFIRSMVRLLAVEPGFEPEGTLIASVGIPPTIQTWEEAIVHFRDLEARIRALPGVEEVGAASQMPFSGGWSAPPATVETSEGLWEGILHISTVNPSYHAAMGIPVVAGRTLSEDDQAESEPVVVVSQALAEMMTPGESPLGRRVRIDVLGVVGDVRYRLNQSPMRMAYAPMEQRPSVLDNWIVRTASNPAGLVSSVRSVAQGVHPEGNSSVQVLNQAIRQSSAVISARFSVILLGSLAGLAAGLAILGVYGVLAYLVQLRSREIGIQLAMGADQSRVLRNVLFRGLGMAGLGLGIGALLSLGLGQVLESQLFGVQSMDPATLLSAGALMLGATLAASFLPARRAARLDPVEVLKGE
jgi:predicted permease